MHQKILNFRDLGGIAVDGGVVKANRLLRGGPLHNLDTQTQEHLVDGYALREIVDLRTDPEVEREPDMQHKDVVYTRLDVMKPQANKEEDVSADPNKMLNQVDMDAKEAMKQLYREFITEENAHIAYRQYFEGLLKLDEGATYFHCSAGKDRTGFAASLVLRLLGASKEDIYEDYLLTNTLNKENSDNLVHKLHQEQPHLTQEALDNYRCYTIVEASYLDEAYRMIDEIYGSFDQYVHEVLNLNGDQILKLKAMYIE